MGGRWLLESHGSACGLVVEERLKLKLSDREAEGGKKVEVMVATGLRKAHGLGKERQPHLGEPGRKNIVETTTTNHSSDAFTAWQVGKELTTSQP